MVFLKSDERRFMRGVSRLIYANPFLPERIEAEKEALGPDFDEPDPVWTFKGDPEFERPNVLAIQERVVKLAGDLRERLLQKRGGLPEEERDLYCDLVLFLLYHRYNQPLYRLIERWNGAPAGGKLKAEIYSGFLENWNRYFDVPGFSLPTWFDPEHLFACFFQIRRAFSQIFIHILGASMPAAQLRASVWQSIFTCDMRRYHRSLYERMGDFATLITGPSGTGKELVARAVGFSRYLPFDERTLLFSDRQNELFFPLNLSALSPTLIESELFGHRKGAFTGAVSDRTGWLEVCGPRGTVFLDEIGDIDPAIQVKLLRVLQDRTFQPIGETKDRRFGGKIIAATNRDLAEQMRQGRFREDLYYRLCSDRIETPSLAEQLWDRPEELHTLLLFISRRLVGPEAESFSKEVEAWIESNLGPDYPWPGNIRELEQCVRNLLIRKEYRPQSPKPNTPHEAFTRGYRDGAFTADELLSRYCTWIYSQTRNYEETGRRLGLDRRTVKSRVDTALLEQFSMEER